MSFTPKPCTHCGGTSFTVLPNIQTELWRPTAVFGIEASESLHARWTFSLVLCTQCARTEVFTNNGAVLGQRVPGAYLVSCAAPTR